MAIYTAVKPSLSTPVLQSAGGYEAVRIVTSLVPTFSLVSLCLGVLY